MTNSVTEFMLPTRLGIHVSWLPGGRAEGRQRTTARQGVQARVISQNLSGHNTALFGGKTAL